jgi:hypothetical protein
VASTPADARKDPCTAHYFAKSGVSPYIMGVLHGYDDSSAPGNTKTAAEPSISMKAGCMD